jgi:hypothetical protein
MTEDEAYLKLDALLRLLQNHEGAIGFNKILELLQKDKVEFDGKLLKMALYQLEKDNYVYELNNIGDKTDTIYLISIQGAIFHGYKKAKCQARWNRLKEKCRTLSLVIGTALAGLYGLFEILKWVFHHFCWKLPF